MTGHRDQIFPTKRPGLRMRLGSNRRLISRISGNAPRCGPHTSTVAAQLIRHAQHDHAAADRIDALAKPIDERQARFPERR